MVPGVTPRTTSAGKLVGSRLASETKALIVFCEAHHVLRDYHNRGHHNHHGARDGTRRIERTQVSEREPIRRVDWDAAKTKTAPPPAPKPEPRDYTRLRLTLQDLKFLYDIGVSCE